MTERASTVTVRPMTAADRSAVLSINAQSAPHVATLDEAEFSRLLEMGAQVLVGVAPGGDVIAYLIAFDRSCAYDGEEFLCLHQTIPEGFTYIDQVAVAPPFHGTGIGRQLYGAVEAMAQAHDQACICCEVNERPQNPGSMSFHAALGFARLGSMETRDGRRVALLTRRR